MQMVLLDLESPASKAQFLKCLDNVFFYLKDVERFEKIHPELVKEPKVTELASGTRKRLSEFDNGLLKYAKRKLKKMPRPSYPTIAKTALKEQEDWLYKGRSKNPKQETLEKRIRKLLERGK